MKVMNTTTKSGKPIEITREDLGECVQVRVEMEDSQYQIKCFWRVSYFSELGLGLALDKYELEIIENN